MRGDRLEAVMDKHREHLERDDDLKEWPPEALYRRDFANDEA
jgi:hypothetical protein